MSPQEISIDDILEICELSKFNNPLDNIAKVSELISTLELELYPPIFEGTLEESRILRTKPKKNVLSITEVRRKIEIGENYLNEFKSTLQFDVKRSQFDPNSKLEDLKSDIVIHSALKTIAGFINWNGGNLLIGVNDQGKIIGLEPDYRLLPEDKRNPDGWELELRNQITGKFENGNLVNQHIDVSFIDIDGLIVAHVDVKPRLRLSFLKMKSGSEFVLYTRQGNSTRQVHINECEEYFEARKNRTGANIITGMRVV